MDRLSPDDAVARFNAAHDCGELTAEIALDVLRAHLAARRVLPRGLVYVTYMSLGEDLKRFEAESGPLLEALHAAGLGARSGPPIL